MKAVFTIMAAGLLLSGARQVPAQPANPRLANAIAAIVDDAVITENEVKTRVRMTATDMLASRNSSEEAVEKQLGSIREEELKTLMNHQLILHEFKTAGYSLPESVVDDIVQERIRAMPGYRDRATLIKTLKEQGITPEKFRQQVKERWIIEQMRWKHVSSEIIISPHKVETYYLAHRDQFKVEDEIKWRWIVLNKTSEENAPKAKKLAEEILAKLKEGASFAEMAAVYSEDGTRNQGGERGWQPKSELRKELAEAAGCLKPGEHSGVIEAPEAFFLILVEDTRPAHFRPLSDVRQNIEKDLLDAEQARLTQQWIERLKKKTFWRTL